MYDRIKSSNGVGFTPMIAAVLVTDQDTGKPIPGARIHVFSSMKGEGEFTLDSDTNGFAQRFYPSVMFSNSISALGFTNHWSCALPDWELLHVAVPGYEDFETNDLRSVATPLRRYAEMPTLVIRIPLRKR